MLHFPGGLKDFLASRIEGQETVTKEFFAGRSNKTEGHGSVEWAIAWVASEDGFLSSYCNTVPTPDGGTHEAGLRAALTKGLRAYGELTGNKRVAQVTAEDVLGTAAAMLSVFIREPEFQGQTKDRLASPEATRIVESARARRLRPLAHRQSAAGEPPARLGGRPRRGTPSPQARKRRSAGRRRRGACGFPASSPIARRAPPKAPRSSSSRATRPVARPSRRATARRKPCCRLRGKILNVASASSTKLADNQLLSDLIQALGCGTGTRYREEELRYEKVVIMTDADVDGAHIASLLITFFYREMRGLIEGGHLYLAVPPLYRLSQGAKTAYARDDAHKASCCWKSEFNGKGKVDVSSFQGLGRDDAEAAQRDDDGPAACAPCCAWSSTRTSSA